MEKQHYIYLLKFGSVDFYDTLLYMTVLNIYDIVHHRKEVEYTLSHSPCHWLTTMSSKRVKKALVRSLKLLAQ